MRRLCLFTLLCGTTATPARARRCALPDRPDITGPGRRIGAFTNLLAQGGVCGFGRW